MLRNPLASGWLLLLCSWVLKADQPGLFQKEYLSRVRFVREMPGFVALWDFVLRDPASQRFTAHLRQDASADFALDAVNYVLDYWGEGRPARYDDFPLLGRGPFGQALRFQAETDPSFRPTLLVPRARLQNTLLDVKGPGRSVSMVVWVLRESGNHAIAGIWHEGTDLKERGDAARRVEPGRRQYAIFAGLAANDGAAAAHVSENGTKSFGDRYARNLAVTPGKIPAVPACAPAEALDKSWSVVGFVFDNGRNTVTAYLNGAAKDYWIEDPEKHPFFQWPARGWQQAQLRRVPGLQPGEDPGFPADQFYSPPETKPRKRRLISAGTDERIELHTYEFTKVRIELRRGADGRFEIASRELAALRVNPFWFGHDLYAPRTEDDGGPFTIGRVIHSGRNPGFAGYIGGVAVFDRPLSPRDMRRLANLHRKGILEFEP
jgi:hypothetical protein